MRLNTVEVALAYAATCECGNAYDGNAYDGRYIRHQLLTSDIMMSNMGANEIEVPLVDEHLSVLKSALLSAKREFTTLFREIEISQKGYKALAEKINGVIEEA